MKVSTINNWNSANNKSREKTNFKGISTVLLVGRQGIGAIKGYKRVKYLEDLQSHLKSYNTKSFLEGINALCKTPDIFFDHDHEGWTGLMDLFACFRASADDEGLRYIPELRFSALDKLDSIPDTSYTGVQEYENKIKLL